MPSDLNFPIGKKYFTNLTINVFSGNKNQFYFKGVKLAELNS